MILKLTVICASFIMIVTFFDFTQALESADEGACIAKISSVQMRRKSYSVIIWRNGRRRAVRRYRNESYLTWTNHTVCCQGYQHNSELDICTPVCSTGCLNGKCIAPSTCQCEPPLYLDPERLNACLTPTCDPVCVNSICNTNNICECENDARRYNKTHCAFCDDHHDITPGMTCRPICDRVCLNGECTAPNTCTCLEGYALSDQFTCSPVCENCVNSSCVAPGVCSCLEGYTAVNETTCTPKCDGCSNGVCVAPGECECFSGYSYENGSCKAECDMVCVNGFCSEPGVCACDDGFVIREQGVCSRPCHPECNGTCDFEGQCTPGFCTETIE